MYVVTGATGNIGREVVRLLLAARQPVRALTRRPDTAGLPAGAEIVGGDLRSDPEALFGAFGGARGLFLNADATGPATGAVVAEARERGVAHVVLISSVYVRDGVAAADQRDAIAGMHRANEEVVERSGPAWTHVRADEFALNDLLQLAPQLAHGDVVRGPYAGAGSPTVHEHDLAAVAVRVLLDGPETHGGRAYAVTGPEVLTEPDRVEQLAQALGRTLEHEEITPEQGRAHLVGAGVPAPVADAVLTELAVRTRRPAPVSDVVATLLGREPLSYRRWLADHHDDLVVRTAG